MRCALILVMVGWVACGPAGPAPATPADNPGGAADGKQPGVAQPARPESVPADEPKTDAQLAKERAMEEARNLGVLGALANRRDNWREAGPADAWWKKEQPCGDGHELNKDMGESGEPEFFCATTAGVRDGRYSKLDLALGGVAVDATYRDGKLHGTHTDLADGKPYDVTEYRDGVKHGPYVGYYAESGAIRARGLYKRGKREGAWTLPYRTRQYRNGLGHGKWTASGKFGNWTIRMRMGRVVSVDVRDEGRRVPSRELAGDVQCRTFVARAKSDYGWDDETSLDPLYVACRVARRALVQCYIDAGNKEEALGCGSAK